MKPIKIYLRFPDLLKLHACVITYQNPHEDTWELEVLQPRDWTSCLYVCIISTKQQSNPNPYYNVILLIYSFNVSIQSIKSGYGAPRETRSLISKCWCVESTNAAPCMFAMNLWIWKKGMLLIDFDSNRWSKVTEMASDWHGVRVSHVNHMTHEII